MDNKKIREMKLISDPARLNITFCKRKKGFIKKAIELSVLCGQEVAFFIYDKQLDKFI